MTFTKMQKFAKYKLALLIMQNFNYYNKSSFKTLNKLRFLLFKVNTNFYINRFIYF